MQSAFVESFNGKARGERLNEHYFESLEDAWEKIEAWRVELQRDPPSPIVEDAANQHHYHRG